MVNSELKALIADKLTEIGYELVDVEYKNMYGDSLKHLVVYCDTVPPGSFALADCEAVNAVLDPLLDEIDFTNGAAYALDVSSPGLDRPFKTQRDYERNFGKEVEVKLYAPEGGKKLYEGVLVSKDDDKLILTIDGRETELKCSAIAVVRPLVKFD